MKENKIPNTEVGANIYLNSRWIANLTEPPKAKDKFISLDLKMNDYILFSNIENSTKDEDNIALRNSWIEVKIFSQLGVFLTLYKNLN